MIVLSLKSSFHKGLFITSTFVVVLHRTLIEKKIIACFNIYVTDVLLLY